MTTRYRDLLLNCQNVTVKETDMVFQRHIYIDISVLETYQVTIPLKIASEQANLNKR